MSDKDYTRKDLAREEISSLIWSVMVDLSPEIEKNLSRNKIAAMLEMPPEANLGDLSLPCFSFSRLLRMPPPKIAEQVKENLLESKCSWIKEIVVAGAFLNFYFDTNKLAQSIINSINNGQFFKNIFNESESIASEKVMVEYSQPNTHKEFHVGHCRNVCLGDSVTRLYQYMGFQVVPVNYIGDEGAHVAKCLWRVKQSGEELPTKNFANWYGSKYTEATQILADADEEQRKLYLQEISQILKEIESKNGYFYDLWEKSKQQCMSDLNDIYKWMNVHFDYIFTESEVSEESQEIVDKYIKEGLFTESDGAFGMSLEDYNLGYFMARKSDGTSLYITKDLALARRKFEDFKIDRSIYVVASEQNFHFKQLFKALELMGFEKAGHCYHLSYAHVTLPEGKMSSRSGNIIPFNKLVEMVSMKVDVHLEKYRDEWSQDEIKETNRKLSLAAIKYGMLVGDPQKEIVFELERWTSFEGQTGPYLMYAYSRTQSIIDNCLEKGFSKTNPNFALLTDPLEHSLLRQMYRFNEVAVSSGLTYKPSILANYLYHLCKSFSKFYACLSVLNAEGKELCEARLALVDGFSQVLKCGLGLLGIETANRM